MGVDSIKNNKVDGQVNLGNNTSGCNSLFSSGKPEELCIEEPEVDDGE